MRPIQFLMDLDTVDVDNVFQDQQLGGAGDFTLNGAGVTGGVWTTPDAVAKQIGFESSGDVSSTYTVTGFADVNKHVALTETLTGPNNSTVETTEYYYHITSIAAGGAVGTNVSAGPVDEAASKIIPLNWRAGNIALNFTVTGTINYTVQQTFDDVNVASQSPFTWASHDDPDLVAATTSQTGNYIANPRAMRVIINSHSAGAALEVSITQRDV